MFCGDVLGPVYYENVLVWLEYDVEGAEVSVDNVGVLVSSFYVNQYLVIYSLGVW